MPNYSFRNKETGEEFTEFFTISGKEEYLKENPNIEQTITSINVVDPYSVGKVKPDNEFKSLLKQIKKNNIHSTINV